MNFESIIENICGLKFALYYEEKYQDFEDGEIESRKWYRYTDNKTGTVIYICVLYSDGTPCKGRSYEKYKLGSYKLPINRIHEGITENTDRWYFKFGDFINALIELIEEIETKSVINNQSNRVPKDLFGKLPQPRTLRSMKKSGGGDK